MEELTGAALVGVNARLCKAVAKIDKDCSIGHLDVPYMLDRGLLDSNSKLARSTWMMGDHGLFVDGFSLVLPLTLRQNGRM